MKLYFCLLVGLGLAQASIIPTKSQLSNAEFAFHKSIGESPDDQYITQELLAFEEIQGKNVIENSIRDLLESFRDVIINGNDNLPPLDPLEIDEVGPFDFEITGLSGSAIMRNLFLEGLRWYTIDEVSVNAIRLSFGFKMTIPRLRFLGTYDARVRVASVLTHQAGGNIGIFINRFEYGLAMRIGTNLLGGHLVLREFDMRLGIGDLIITVDGLTGSSLVNGMIQGIVNNISQDVVLENLDNINQAVSEALFEAINDVLKDYTLADILG